mgnify:CR=1 FL=1|tara:strand:- start:1952 stop:2431 length:480 start_codon:yes stop_codon:yes gene_type:complete
MKYRIELEEEQLDIIAKCLELASRMQCGQLDIRTLFPLDNEAGKHLRSLDDESYSIKREKVDRLLLEIKAVLWKDLREGGHWGIKYDERSDHLYEMYKQILHTFEKEKKKEREESGEKYSTNVHSGLPLDLTDNPKIEVYPLTTEVLREENIDNVLQSE